MRFSISIPQRDTDGFDAAGMKGYLARAEDLGSRADGRWSRPSARHR